MTLVVLLSALSMRRVGFGLVLIVAFSVGLAAVLVAIGVLMVYARRLMARFREDGPLIHRWCRRWRLQEADAQDVAQDVLLKLHGRMATFNYDPSGSFRAWLKTLAHHA